MMIQRNGKHICYGNYMLLPFYHTKLINCIDGLSINIFVTYCLLIAKSYFCIAVTLTEQGWKRQKNIGEAGMSKSFLSICMFKRSNSWLTEVVMDSSIETIPPKCVS